jgi:glycosyltransferase involved in cell wall biosynthesis
LTSPHFYPTYGGAQNRYRSYIPGFLERGLDVHIMTGTPQVEERSERDVDSSWYDAKPGEWLPSTVLDGAPLDRIRLPDSKKRSRTKIYYDGIVEMCKRTEAQHQQQVVQMLTNMRPQALPWLRELKAHGAAVMYSVSVYPTWPQKPVKRLFRGRGYRKVFNEFDALVTNSETIGDFLHDLGVTTRVEYIPNGVNLARFQPVGNAAQEQARRELRQSFGIPEHANVIAMVGAVMPRKGPDTLLRAWRTLLDRHPDTHVLLVGPRADTHDPKNSAYGEEIADLVATSKAPGQVHFAGIVDNVQDYLRAADLFVLASSREGTPNSVLEAMATGLPCVVTPYIGISAAIGEADTHYRAAQRTPEAIAAALGDFIDNPGAARELGRRGRRFVEEKADQQRSLDRYVALYEEVAAQAAHRGG